ncbi:MAG: rod shape-determining protein MreC [Desulfobacteraceae bacterium]|jgi:rod shape-determining protein MreC
MFSKRMVMIVGLIALVTISILSLSLSSREPYPAYGPGRIAISLVAPFQKMLIGTTRFFRDIWEHYFFLISVAEENELLRRELREARALNHRHREAMLANQRLRRLLALEEEMTQPVIAARVVGKDPSPWFQSVTVDKGTADGVRKGQPVINPEGIVGLVTDAAAHYAKVMLITDPNSAVDAVIQENRARGIVKGGTSGYCVLNFVLRKHPVAVGHLVISSGMDGVFPKGLPIGAVAAIVKQKAGIFQDVTVAPYVDFERLEEVLIVPLSEGVAAP